MFLQIYIMHHHAVLHNVACIPGMPYTRNPFTLATHFQPRSINLAFVLDMQHLGYAPKKSWKKPPFQSKPPSPKQNMFLWLQWCIRFFKQFLTPKYPGLGGVNTWPAVAVFHRQRSRESHRHVCLATWFIEIGSQGRDGSVGFSPAVQQHGHGLVLVFSVWHQLFVLPPSWKTKFGGVDLKEFCSSWLELNISWSDAIGFGMNRGLGFFHIGGGKREKNNLCPWIERVRVWSVWKKFQETLARERERELEGQEVEWRKSRGHSR